MPTHSKENRTITPLCILIITLVLFLFLFFFHFVKSYRARSKPVKMFGLFLSSGMFYKYNQLYQFRTIGFLLAKSLF